jgi:hypothetical protein
MSYLIEIFLHSPCITEIRVIVNRDVERLSGQDLPDRPTRGLARFVVCLVEYHDHEDDDVSKVYQALLKHQVVLLTARIRKDLFTFLAFLLFSFYDMPLGLA